MTTEHARAIYEWRRMSEDSASDVAKRKERREAIVGDMSLNKWDPTLRGSCWKHRWGFWLGRPLNFSAEVHLAGPSPVVDGERDVEAYLATGIAWIPNAYFAVLGGVTHGTVRADRTDGDTTEGVWAGTFAVGGNLDLASLFVK